MEFTKIDGKVALVFAEVPAVALIKTKSGEVYVYENGSRVVDADRVAVLETVSIGTSRPFPRDGSTLLISSSRDDYISSRRVLSKVFEIMEV